jgi:hypothetical protein
VPARGAVRLPVFHEVGLTGRSRRSPATIRGAYRLGDTPFTTEAADRMAKRVHAMVEADPNKSEPAYWGRRIGLDDAELAQVLGRYEELYP